MSTCPPLPLPKTTLPGAFLATLSSTLPSHGKPREGCPKKDIPYVTYLKHAGKGTFSTVWYAFSADFPHGPLGAVKFFANTDVDQAKLQFDNEKEAAKDIGEHPRILQFVQAK
jgi:hypothetical protein